MDQNNSEKQELLEEKKDNFVIIDSIIPQFQKFSKYKNILLAGMGGGYDVFSAIPLFFQLKMIQKNVFLANLSFTRDLNEKMKFQQNKGQFKNCYEVRFKEFLDLGLQDQFEEKLGYPKNYFPEFHLSKWLFNTQNIDAPVYTFQLLDLNSKNSSLGVAELKQEYQVLIQKLNIDCIIQIDAGVDSLLMLDEEGLGTIAEDLLSILAIKDFQNIDKYLYCIGLSTEGNISEYDFLQNLSKIQNLGGYFGCIGWNQNNEFVKKYQEAIENCCPVNTTIQSQISGAISGLHGHECPKSILKRLGGQTGAANADIFMNVFMTIGWLFDLDVVIKTKLFVDQLENSVSLTDLLSKLDVARLKNNITGKTKIFYVGYKGKREYKSMFENQ